MRLFLALLVDRDFYERRENYYEEIIAYVRYRYFRFSGILILAGQAVVPAQNGSAGAEQTESRPDSPQANPYVLFQTSQGNLFVELLPQSVPVTVNNFLSYVDGHHYDGSFVHRSVPNFVVQGGSFHYINDSIFTFATQPPIVLEHGVSNVAGTITMARIYNDLNSATDQWFFNIVDNIQLDTLDGGYAVFGRVSGSASRQVLSRIAAVPVFNFGDTFYSLPLVNYTNGNVTNANLVTVLSVSRVSSVAPGTGVSAVSSDGSSQVVFANVTDTGGVSFANYDMTAASVPVPSVYQTVTGWPAKDISTSAVYSGNVVSCLQLPSTVSPTDFALARILHLENGSWIDRTILAPDTPAPDFNTKIVCARTTSLSPFAAVKTASAPPATVSVGGKVYSAAGTPLRGAVVTVTNQIGRRSVMTNPFGIYNFDQVSTTGTATISVSSKRYRFSTANIQPSANLSTLDFTGIE